MKNRWEVEPRPAVGWVGTEVTMPNTMECRRRMPGDPLAVGLAWPHPLVPVHTQPLVSWVRSLRVINLFTAGINYFWCYSSTLKYLNQLKLKLDLGIMRLHRLYEPCTIILYKKICFYCVKISLWLFSKCICELIQFSYNYLLKEDEIYTIRVCAYVYSSTNA